MLQPIHQKYLFIALLIASICGLLFYEYEPLFRYLIGINAATFFLCASDKSNSSKDKERIPEAVFYILSLIGGSLGMILGMGLLRHKTRKASFQIVVFSIAVMQAVIFIYTK